MIQSKSKGLGGRLALLLALAALMAMIGASAAAAKVTLSASTNLPEEALVTVSGKTVPTGTDHVAIAVCSTKAAPGKQCDRESGTGETFASESEYTEGVSVPVRRSWLGFDFTMGLPAKATGEGTTCYGTSSTVGDACDVFVSFYSTSEGFKHLGSEAASIDFE